MELITPYFAPFFLIANNDSVKVKGFSSTNVGSSHAPNGKGLSRLWVCSAVMRQR